MHGAATGKMGVGVKDNLGRRGDVCADIRSDNGHPRCRQKESYPAGTLRGQEVCRRAYDSIFNGGENRVEARDWQIERCRIQVENG